ncbi:MAG: nucleotidyltransferase family protein [Hyphomicrobiales bacterium]|nr:nucleotidyltransferase family protein [Hyphomicrobiales bacterium]
MERNVGSSWLLGKCLSLDLRTEDLASLRAQLLTSNVLFDLSQFATEQALIAALAGRLLEGVLVPPGNGSRPGPADGLRQYLATHEQRREQMTRLLRETAEALNAIGIQPILLKGARSLWERKPAWRFLRDIDVLVPFAQAQAAARALREHGYYPDQSRPARPHHHHLAALYSEGPQGWVEIHKRGGNRYAERLVPTAELIASSTPSTDNGISVGLLDPVTHIIHAMVHHHVGHGGDARATLSLKGLYEFAWAANELTLQQKHRMVERAAAHPRLAAILDLWLAAASRLFGLTIAQPFVIAPDAAERAELLLGAERRGGWKYSGYGDEIRMAWASERLRRLSTGNGLVGRQILRWRVIASMLPAISR